MNKIELLNYWLNLTKFDENQTSFKIFSKDWKFNENNKKMIKFFNEWDDSGTTSLLYAKFMFLDLIKIQTITIFDLLENNIDNLDEFKYLYNKFNSNEFKELESDLILAFEQILSKLNNKKLIGKLNIEDLLSCAKNVLENILTLNIDVFQKGGEIKEFYNFSNQIYVFETLSKCLLTLENSLDGMYLCYISNEDNTDGYFGIYIKNNGNLFSINERLEERYIGQNKSRRNHRYTEDKAYDLFPYEIVEFNGEDSKGYATEHKINRDKLTFDNLSNSSLMNIIVMLFLLSKKYVGKILTDDEVYVNSLFEVNVKPVLELSNDRFDLIPLTTKSELIKSHKKFEILFSKEEFLNGKLCEKFSSPDLKYSERGYFQNINQKMVEKFGQDFNLENALKNVFETDRTRLLLDSDVDQSKKSKCFNNEYVGTKHKMELQAFYIARKRLAKHITNKQIKSFNDFGGKDKLKEWYNNLLLNNVEMIKKLCVDVYKDPDNGVFTYVDNFRFEDSIRQIKWVKYLNTDDKESNNTIWLSNDCFNKINFIKFPYNHFDKIKCKDLDNGKECFHFFKFTPISIEHLRNMFNVEFPDFCEGYWYYNSSIKPYTGNSILEIVDPVDDLNSILCIRNSDYFFNFSFCIGFSKSSFNKMLKGK
jgi:hypothetical protein